MTGNTHRRRVGGAGSWVALGLCAALFAGPGLTEEEAKSPEPLEAELVGIRTMITNASSKLKNNIVGIQSGAENAPATPAGQCCAMNIKRIDQRIGTAHRILGDFDRCYTRGGDQDMVLKVRIAQSDLAAFAKALSAFANAPTRGQTHGALQAMTRTYNLLRESAIALEPCEGLESTVDPDEESANSGDGAPKTKPREE